MLESLARALEVGSKARNRAAEAIKARDMLALLTKREHEVLDQLVKGHANKIAAHKLGISPRTIEIHRARIMDRLGARNLPDVVRISLSAA